MLATELVECITAPSEIFCDGYVCARYLPFNVPREGENYERKREFAAYIRTGFR